MKTCLTAFAVLFSTTLVTAAEPSAASADAAPRPNIVLIVADDLGYGDLGCYGSKKYSTPHIDSLAAGGVRLTQFRVNPLCAPTRASLLSGLYSLQTGIWRGPSREGAASDTRTRELHPELRLLPQYLKKAGYTTGMFGKWHLGYQSPNTPNDRGFDEFVGFLGGAHPYSPDRGQPLLRNGKPIDDQRHLTDLFTDEAIAFIEAHRNEPFFCYLPYNAVHGPLWTEARQTPSGRPDWLAKAEARGLDFPERDYSAVLEHLDDSVGRIGRTLQTLGIDDRTLVIFISDNGAIVDKFPGDNGPLRGQKGETWEGGIRVPAICRWPGVIPAGQTSDAATHVFDLFATILEVAGIAVPRENGGREVPAISLLAHLRTGEAAAFQDRYLFWDLFGRLGAYHDGWKLVGTIDNHRGRFDRALPQIKAAKFELYRLSDDLGEQKDLSEVEPEVAARLKQRLVDWFQESTR